MDFDRTKVILYFILAIKAMNLNMWSISVQPPEFCDLNWLSCKINSIPFLYSVTWQ